MVIIKGKNLMKKLIAVFTTFILACSFCFSAHAALITLTPSAGVVNLGDSVSVDLTVSGLATDEELALFDLDAIFDPAVLNLTSIAFGSALGGTANALQLDFLPNAFENSFLSELDLQFLQGAPFTILTLNFDTLATSVTSIVSVSINAFGFLDFDGNEIDVNVQSTTITVVDAPVAMSETGTLLLMITGLGVLLSRRLK